MITASLVASLALLSSDFAVRCHNQGNVDSNVLQNAMDLANRAFKQARFVVDWQSCQRGREGSCDMGVEAFDLLLTASSADYGNAAKVRLGMAMLVPGRPSRYAKIFLPRVEQFAMAVDVPVATVLGYAIAHEIGHLLTGHIEHSPTGIMKAIWDREDRSFLNGNRLSFHPDEIRLMKQRVSQQQHRQGP